MKAGNKIYEAINQKIIKLLQEQLNGYEQTWFNVKTEMFGRNPHTQHYYSALNNFLLQISLIFFRPGYYLNRWMTFLQVQDIGAKIKKGSFADMIVFTSHIWVDEQGKNVTKNVGLLIDAGLKIPDHYKKIPFLKGYNVFNVADIEGLPEEYTKPQNVNITASDRINTVDEIINRTGAVIDETNTNRAYYIKERDIIRIAKRWQFNTTEDFYKALFHELGHWTGHNNRLNRDMSQEREKYAFEELVAELTAAYCCAKLNICAEITNNAAYLQAWLKALDSDMKFFTHAAAQAQKAADYILTCNNEEAEGRRAA
jgi:antirestriction protein ArdC